MSFTDVLEKLTELSPVERQILVQRALELDDPPLFENDEVLIESRLAEHERDPASSLTLEEFKARMAFRTKL